MFFIISSVYSRNIYSIKILICIIKTAHHLFLSVNEMQHTHIFSYKIWVVTVDYWSFSEIKFCRAWIWAFRQRKETSLFNEALCRYSNALCWAVRVIISEILRTSQWMNDNEKIKGQGFESVRPDCKHMTYMVGTQICFIANHVVIHKNISQWLVSQK